MLGSVVLEDAGDADFKTTNLLGVLDYEASGWVGFGQEQVVFPSTNEYLDVGVELVFKELVRDQGIVHYRGSVKLDDGLELVIGGVRGCLASRYASVCHTPDYKTVCFLCQA